GKGGRATVSRLYRHPVPSGSEVQVGRSLRRRYVFADETLRGSSRSVVVQAVYAHRAQGERIVFLRIGPGVFGQPHAKLHDSLARSRRSIGRRFSDASRQQRGTERRTNGRKIPVSPHFH